MAHPLITCYATSSPFCEPLPGAVAAYAGHFRSIVAMAWSMDIANKTVDATPPPAPIAGTAFAPSALVAH